MSRSPKLPRSLGSVSFARFPFLPCPVPSVLTLDKTRHFVDSLKAPCPVCKGFRGLGQDKLSTKRCADRKHEKRGGGRAAGRKRTAAASTSPASRPKGLS